MKARRNVARSEARQTSTLAPTRSAATAGRAPKERIAPIGGWGHAVCSARVASDASSSFIGVRPYILLALGAQGSANTLVIRHTYWPRTDRAPLHLGPSPCLHP